MGFINTKWQRDMSGNLVNAGLRLGGAITASVLLEKFAPYKDKPTNTEKTMYNIGGPAVLLTGLALDVLGGNDYLRALAQGMTLVGATHSIAVIAPSVGESFGLNGIAPAVPKAVATPSKPAMLMGTQAALMGAVGNVAELPKEFAAIDPAKFKQDGNDWNKVAAAAEDPNAKIQVEGLSEKSAQLFGIC